MRVHCLWIVSVVWSISFVFYNLKWRAYMCLVIVATASLNFWLFSTFLDLCVTTLSPFTLFFSLSPSLSLPFILPTLSLKLLVGGWLPHNVVTFSATCASETQSPPCTAVPAAARNSPSNNIISSTCDALDHSIFPTQHHSLLCGVSFFCCWIWPSYLTQFL